MRNAGRRFAQGVEGEAAVARTGLRKPFPPQGCFDRLGSAREFNGKLTQRLPCEMVNTFLCQPAAIARVLAEHFRIHNTLRS